MYFYVHVASNICLYICVFVKINRIGAGYEDTGHIQFIILLYDTRSDHLRLRLIFRLQGSRVFLR